MYVVQMLGTYDPYARDHERQRDFQQPVPLGVPFAGAYPRAQLRAKGRDGALVPEKLLENLLFPQRDLGSVPQFALADREQMDAMEAS